MPSSGSPRSGSPGRPSSPSVSRVASTSLATSSLWVRIADADAVAFTRLAVSYGVIVRAGPLASPDGGFRDHIRLAYGGEPEDIVEGVERLAAAWAAYQPVARLARSAVAVSV